jgi:hypothetical protein
LRVGGRPIGLRALQRQIDIACIESGDHIALLRAIALGHEDVEDATANFRRHLHFGGFDLTGDARVGCGCLVPAGRRDQRGHAEQRSDGVWRV